MTVVLSGRRQGSTHREVAMLASLPPELCSPHAQWLVDEIDLEDGDQPGYTHAVLFSNGWQVGLRFRDMRVTAVQPLLPAALQQSA